MLEVIFIRHGKTITNVEGRFTGQSDIPVLPESLAEMATLTREHPYPPMDAIYRSPLLRCKQTAECLFPGRTATAIDNLIEVNFGVLEGTPLATGKERLGMDRFRSYDLTLDFEGGESLRSALDRAIAGVDEIVRDAQLHDFQRVAVVSHSMLSGVFLCHQADPAMTREQSSWPNGHGIDVTIDPDEWRTSRRVRFRGFLPSLD